MIANFLPYSFQVSTCSSHFMTEKNLIIYSRQNKKGTLTVLYFFKMHFTRGRNTMCNRIPLSRRQSG